MAAIPPPNSSSFKDSRTQKSESKDSSSMGKLAEAQLAHQGTRTSPSMSWYSVSSQGTLLEYIQQQSGKITTEFETSKAVRKRIEALEDELDAKSLSALIKKELKGFQISISDAELEKLLEEDIKNDDVPVFYQQGETLFYGTKPLSIIGKLK